MIKTIRFFVIICNIIFWVKFTNPAALDVDLPPIQLPDNIQYKIKVGPDKNQKANTEAYLQEFHNYFARFPQTVATALEMAVKYNNITLIQMLTRTYGSNIENYYNLEVNILNNNEKN